MSEIIRPPDVGALRFTRPDTNLTDREFASLQKVASYRGLVGKQAAEIRRLKAGIRDALDQLRPEEPAHRRLSIALEGK